MFPFFMLSILRLWFQYLHSKIMCLTADGPGNTAHTGSSLLAEKNLWFYLPAYPSNIMMLPILIWFWIGSFYTSISNAREHQIYWTILSWIIDWCSLLLLTQLLTAIYAYTVEKSFNRAPLLRSRALIRKRHTYGICSVSWMNSLLVFGGTLITWVHRVFCWYSMIHWHNTAFEFITAAPHLRFKWGTVHKMISVKINGNTVMREARTPRIGRTINILRTFASSEIEKWNIQPATHSCEALNFSKILMQTTRVWRNGVDW